jgi:hypothetical protein
LFPEAFATRLSCAERVNFQWARLLDLLEINVWRKRSSGTKRFTKDGDRHLDFLLAAESIRQVAIILDSLKPSTNSQIGSRPAMLESHVPEAADEVAARLLMGLPTSASQQHCGTDALAL